MTVGKYNDAVLSLIDLPEEKPPVVKYVTLDGVAGSYVSTPDTAPLSITGDIDIRAKLSLVDWTPAIEGQICCKFVVTGNQKSWRFAADEAGYLLFSKSADGFLTGTNAGSTPHGFSDGSLQSVRVTCDVSTGETKFWTSSDGGASWDVLSTHSIESTGIYDSTAPVEIGSINQGGLLLAVGDFYHVQIYDGIDGTLVSDMNPSDHTSGDSWVSDLTGETWTLNGNATISEVS